MYQKKTVMSHFDSSLFDISHEIYASEGLEELMEAVVQLEEQYRRQRIMFFSEMFIGKYNYIMNYELWELRQGNLES